MTFRRSVRTSIIATAIAVGAAALPVSVAGAAPVVAPSLRSPAALSLTVTAVSVQTVAPAERGDDLLVDQAADGLDAWMAFRATGDGPALQRYRLLRDSVATAAATRLGIDPARMVQAWRSADMAHQLVVLTAFTQLGTPYRAFQRRPGHGFDCSGFTSWAWGGTGVELARNSRRQIRNAAKRSADTAQPGDLVYYPGHVMLYLGVDHAIIHAPQTGRSVELSFVSKRHTRWARYGNPIG